MNQIRHRMKLARQTRDFGLILGVTLLPLHIWGETLTEERQETAPSKKEETPSVARTAPGRSAEILEAARHQQEIGNLEISRKLLSDNAEAAKGNEDEFILYITGWRELDHTLAKSAIPEATRDSKSRDQTQGEAWLRETFDKRWNEGGYPGSGLLHGMGYQAAKILWQKEYVLGWRDEARNQIAEIEGKRLAIDKSLATLEIIKKSEQDLLSKTETAIADNYKWAEKLGPFVQQCRANMAKVSTKRTDWLSFSVISPYLGDASLEAWAASYDKAWEKNQTLKRACAALGRCNKDQILQCNEPIRTQFAEAFGDLRKACGKDSDLFESLKVYQLLVTQLGENSTKKGASGWVEQ